MSPTRWTRALAVVAVATALGCTDTPPKLHLDKSVVPTGEDLVVVFDEPLTGKATNQYWVTLARPDAPLSDTSGRIVLDRSARTVRLHTSSPGELEVRLYGSYPRLDHQIVARIRVTVEGWPVKAGTAQTANGNECLDEWLLEHKLDPYGAPEGTAYAGASPLYDEATGRWSSRWDYVTSKHEQARAACERSPR